MIRENQRLLNLFHIIIDALIIAAAFLLSYELRFNELWSPLIRHHIISPPIGYYLRLDQYLNTLVFLIHVLSLYTVSAAYTIQSEPTANVMSFTA